MASEKVAHAGACELVPDVELGLLVDGQVNIVQARQIFARKKSFVIGVPGAYTPICSKLHVPELVRDANRLRRAGYDLIACIASNDPFVLQRWAQDLDPQNKVTFLSDGNLEFARALDLVHQVPDLFARPGRSATRLCWMGERSSACVSSAACLTSHAPVPRSRWTRLERPAKRYSSSDR